MQLVDRLPALFSLLAAEFLPLPVSVLAVLMHIPSKDLASPYLGGVILNQDSCLDVRNNLEETRPPETFERSQS